MIDIIISLVIGILIGIFTGLTPGIHINMVSLLLLSSAPWIMGHFHLSVISLAVFIVSMGITHTFLDAVPSIFLGAPDESTALGVLPGHRYLLRGNGLMAVKLYSIGSFFGLVVSIIIFPLLYLITKLSYHFFERYFAWILILVALFMIFRDDKKLWAILVFVMGGLLGLSVFNIGMKDPLFPMLSGLFGISTLIISFFDNNKIPEQKELNHTELESKKTFSSLLLGNISSFIVSTFPGLSSSIAAVMSLQLNKDLGDKGFMILLGCIGTSGFILSLVALLAVDKARNGAVIVIAQLMDVNVNTVIILIFTALIVGAIALYLSLVIGSGFSKLISKVNYRILITCVVIFVTFMVFIITSWIGLLVLIVSTAIGLIPAIVKVQRTHSMSCIMVPVIAYFL